MNPLPVSLAMMRRHAGICGVFVLLIALAVGIGAAITAQERALRHGSARAADRFDLIVAAPGSQTDLLLKVVYLQPGSVELVEGEPLRQLMSETRAEFVAPIGFGDSVRGAPIVGTIAALVEHLSGGALAEGRPFERRFEAVVGAASPLGVGDRFQASHGHAPTSESTDYHPQDIAVVGRMAPTGSPWDRAVLVPIEFVWQVHGLGTGHHDLSEARIGPPFDLDVLPGIPAALVKPRSIAEAYGLRNNWRSTATTAFFPAEVLVSLYELLGDVRLVMSALAVATEALVVAGILCGILILMRLYRQRLAVLRALGASRAYVFAVIWTFSFTLVAAGSLIGLGIAALLCGIVSDIFAEASGVALQSRIGPAELALAATIAAVGAITALLPAALLYRLPVVEALRG